MALLRRKRNSPGAKADINITPLIDVLLVLIVIFMVISPQGRQGLETTIPTPAPTETQQVRAEPLVLTLTDDGEIRLNQERVGAARLSARLHEVFQTRADRALFVQASSDAQFNEVVGFIDEARGAGAERIGLMTNAIRK